jgi:glyoxylase-like metal-dependent hydrolase (beta-lactamase superfamily II)/rhodanese-related sulfurtransferase
VAAGDVHPIPDESLANTSYIVDAGDGRAAVIDPRRDTDQYFARAEQLGLRIVASLETHLHADFVSGSRELVRSARADVIAPAGADLRFPHRPVSDGETVRVGETSFDVLHTPGHTPEHVAYLMAEPTRAVFSGGSLIGGGAARTDLTGAEHTVELARAQYGSLHRIAELGDEVALHPTHGAGSFCSTGADRRTAATIGEERRSNTLLAEENEEAFVDRLLGGFGSYPPYFLHLRDMNRKPSVLEELAPPGPLPPGEIVEAVDRGAWLIDGRAVERWAMEHPRGAVSIALRPQFASWLGWVVPFDEPIVFLLDDDRLREALRLARRIGYDRLLGWLEGGVEAWVSAGHPTASLDVVTAEEARARSDDGATLLDVRQRSEWQQSRVPGAMHIELGDIIAGNRPAGEIITFCGHGERSATAASFLLRDGGRVATLAGGLAAWERAGLPIER